MHTQQRLRSQEIKIDFNSLFGILLGEYFKFFAGVTAIVFYFMYVLTVSMY